MKTKSLFLLLGVLSLLTVTSCADQMEVNPNFNPETNEVMTKLVMNFSTDNSVQTKQTAAAVQKTSSSFRGITDAKMLTYNLTSGGILRADADANKLFDLGTVLTADGLGGTSPDNTKNSHRVLEMSLPIQTSTILFYGVAPQPASPDLATNTDGLALTVEDCYGSLENYNMTVNKNSGLFEMKRRLQDATNYRFIQNMLAATLTAIVNTKISSNTSFAATGTPEAGIKPYGFNYTYSSEVSWRDYFIDDPSSSITIGTDGTVTYVANTKSPIDNNQDLSQLEEKLANAYKQMTYIVTWGGEIRAASMFAICNTVQDLASTLNEIRCAEPLNEREAAAKYMATEIIKRIKRYFNITVPTTSLPASNTSYLTDLDGIGDALITDNAAGLLPTLDNPYTFPSGTQVKAFTEGDKIASFPIDFGIPRGAAYMAFDWVKFAFYYPEKFNTTGMEGAQSSSSGQFDASSYFYPPKLLYFGNSPIKCSETEMSESDYPNGVGSTSYVVGEKTIQNWHSTSAWPSSIWSLNRVTASTRSVAISYDINYGTALLETKVMYASSILKDNNHAIQKRANPNYPWPPEDEDPGTVEPDKQITVTDNTFKLTGIVIGGQYYKVDWDFLPKAEADGSFKQGFVYDRAISNGSIPASGVSSATYTMVFDNLHGARDTDGYWTAYQTSSGGNDGQDKVYVALEFKNNSGEDFFGEYNLIKKNGYFYLIAELDPNKSGLTAVQWPTQGWYVLPPYLKTPTSTDLDKTREQSKQITRVFMQDYMTSATFAFGENSLKHAYLTVPDLRSGSLSLGLSVDLNWSTGLVFENALLGGN